MAVFTTLLVLSIVVATLACVDIVFRLSKDAREPPDPKHRIPYLSHILGFLKRGMSYYDLVGSTQSSSIYTLRVPFISIYVTNGTSLVTSIQRAAKTVSFTPFQKLTAAKWSMVSRETLHLFDAGAEHPGTGQYIKDIDHETHNALLPGPGLDQMNSDTAVEVVKCMAEINGDGDAPTDLYKWVRRTITKASTTGVWGPKNPYLKEDLCDRFWAFDQSLKTMIAGWPFHLLATNAQRGRKEVEAGFETYFYESGQQEASELAQGRHKVHVAYGLTVKDTAKMEWPLTIGILSNTVPTAFWTICEIFARPELLKLLRHEITGAVVIKDYGNAAPKHFTLDIAKVKSQCKTLLSVFQETQRTRSKHATIRKVLADTVLEQKFLLKKGNYLQLPSAPIHTSTSLWGPDAATFDAERFSREPRVKVPPNNFMAWGSAPHLCPARQFATMEILSLVALLVLRFDVVPVEGNFLDGDVDVSRMSTVLPPKKALRVVFGKRLQWEGEWVVDVGESASKFQLASG